MEGWLSFVPLIHTWTGTFQTVRFPQYYFFSFSTFISCGAPTPFVIKTKCGKKKRPGLFVSEILNLSIPKKKTKTKDLGEIQGCRETCSLKWADVYVPGNRSKTF